MSRESLLDEAIVKAKEAEDWQLVEWLRMARGGESAARWYTAKLSEARLDISNLMTENAKLREQMERLVTLLRVDCDIDASWDGLRRFWSIGLTEDGCLMRDRACKAEAENAKLRALCRDMYLVVELLDMDGVRLQAHGRDADWRTLKERYDELGVVE